MTKDDALSTFARQLFSDPELDPEPEPEQPPDRSKNNLSPREGTNPTVHSDQDLQTFTAELFSRAD